MQSNYNKKQYYGLTIKMHFIYYINYLEVNNMGMIET